MLMPRRRYNACEAAMPDRAKLLAFLAALPEG
jgi:hypothetical protein